MRGSFLDYPIEVSIETMTLCNARCTFCPYPTLDRKGTKMPDELLNKLTEEMISWRRPMYFSPFKLSEPLLDKRVLPLLERIYRATDQIGIRLFSNGSTLTPDNIRAVARLPNVHTLWVSLNEHRPEEYEKLMGLRFEQTVKKLDYLHEYPFPHKVILGTVGSPNEEFRSYCNKRWPKFEAIAIKKDAWLGYTDPQIIDVPDTPCSRWFELSITSTGVVALCCMDGKTEFPIGDINKQTMLEVYNSPHWRERREKLLSRKAVPVCQTCTYVWAALSLVPLVSSLAPILKLFGP